MLIHFYQRLSTHFVLNQCLSLFVSAYQAPFPAGNGFIPCLSELGFFISNALTFERNKLYGQ
jgi:hypothetical protein